MGGKVFWKFYHGCAWSLGTNVLVSARFSAALFVCGLPVLFLGLAATGFRVVSFPFFSCFFHFDASCSLQLRDEPEVAGRRVFELAG